MKKILCEIVCAGRGVGGSMKVIHRAGEVVVRGLNACGEWEVVQGSSIYYTNDRKDAIETADDINRRTQAQCNAADDAHEVALDRAADASAEVFEDLEEVKQMEYAREIEKTTRKVEAKRRARSFLRTSARFMRVKER